MSQDIRFLPNLSQLTYVSERQHMFAAEGFERPEGANIGRNGEHLTIMFLSLNRTALSERLCRSIVDHIPNFQGEILAIDNASEPEELAALEAMMESLPLRTRVVRMDRNHGVGGGRNRGLDHVTTEWVLSLDNDIFFVCNPLLHWQQEIAQLGCRFFSLALLDPGEDSVFLRGGHLYLGFWDGEVHVGGGSTCPSSDARRDIGAPWLGTCMMGGAGLYHKATFQRVGGYDDDMFVGFEDYEFALRLFREGYKIGCTSLAALVHDHPKPTNKADTDYEKTRFRRDHLAESAAVFERKHGFKVWNRGVTEWLSQRKADLGIADEDDVDQAQEHAAPAVTSGPKILLVTDRTGWAFSNIADQIEKHLGSQYDVRIVAADEVAHFGQVALLGAEADIVHMFWRPQLRFFLNSTLDNYGTVINRTGRQIREGLFSRRISTAVYDHLFLDGPLRDEINGLLSDFVDGYYTSSVKLDSIYRAMIPHAPPIGLVQDGVDDELFSPRSLERFERDHGPLTVGWVGNSKWAAEQEDFKGYHTIIKPAIDALKEQGLDIREVNADRQLGYIPHAMMADYYAKIDVLLCASKMEGTPNPVLEAMTCGVPVITTDVGIVTEAFGPMQTEYVLRTRSQGAMQDAIFRAYHDRASLRACSAENLLMARPWRWADRALNFRRYIDALLAKPPRPRHL